MDLDDLSGMAPSTPDQKLREHIETFVESVETHPDATTNDGRTIGTQLAASELGLGRKDWPLPMILSPVSDPEVTDFDEVKELVQFVREQFEYELEESELKQILVDALGMELDVNPANIQRAFSRLNSHLHGFGKGEVIIPIRGIQTEKGGVIVDRFHFESVYPRSVNKPLAGVYQATIKEEPIPAHTIIRYPVEYEPSDPPNHVEHHTNELLREVLQLYTATKCGNSGSLLDLYGRYPEGFFSDPEGAPMEPVVFSAHDGRRLEALLKIAVESVAPPQWRSTIERAMSHYTHAVDSWTNVYESITFAYIGLEALYGHLTTDQTPNRDIHRYVGFLLSTAGWPQNAIEIRDHVQNDLYTTRNNWVHGGTTSSSLEMEPTEAQRKAWNYLRASIVTFAWMESNTNHFTNSGLPLSDALIDDTVRRQIKADLDDFDISQYLCME